MDSKSASSGWTSPPAIVAYVYIATYVAYAFDTRHDLWHATRVAHGVLAGILAALVLLAAWNWASYWPGKAKRLAAGGVAILPFLPFVYVSRGPSVPALVVGLAALALHEWYNRRIYEYLNSLRSETARRLDGSFVLFTMLLVALVMLGGFGAWFFVEFPWEQQG